mgnify:CR=1 FL=1
MYRPPLKNETLRLVRQRPPQQIGLGLGTRAAVRMCPNGRRLGFFGLLFSDCQLWDDLFLAADYTG